MTTAFHAYDSTLAMTHGLAEEVAGRLGGALASRGGASFVVTGGTTAGPLYDRLCRARLAWDRIFVTLSDERWTPTGSADANETLVRERLLVHNAERARFTPLKTDARTAVEAESKVNWMIAVMRRPFDVTLLGMGADGHVASLFAGGEGVDRAMDLNDPAFVRAVRYDRAAGATERMTLTLRALLESRFIAIMIRGADKRAAYEKALNTPADANPAPVGAILHQDIVPVGVYWAP
jgi:6-phosphogluconolactonase